MENKYYTPTIEEFCVGFEFEERANVYPRDEFWRFPVKKVEFTEKFYTNLNNMHRLSLDLHDKDIRVKWLDEGDILKLGWLKTEHKKDYGYGTTTFIFDKSTEFPNITDVWTLVYAPYSKIISIKRSQMSSYGDAENTQDYYIKNKSELKRLMYQLEIIE